MSLDGLVPVVLLHGRLHDGGPVFVSTNSSYGFETKMAKATTKQTRIPKRQVLANRSFGSCLSSQASNQVPKSDSTLLIVSTNQMIIRMNSSTFESETAKNNN